MEIHSYMYGIIQLRNWIFQHQTLICDAHWIMHLKSQRNGSVMDTHYEPGVMWLKVKPPPKATLCLETN